MKISQRKNMRIIKNINKIKRIKRNWKRLKIYFKIKFNKRIK